VHRSRDLLVRQPPEFAHDECLALPRRKVGDRARDLCERGPVGDDVRRVGNGARPGVVERSGAGGPQSAAALVSGDGGEPRGWVPRLRAAEQASVGAEKRLLSSVFRGLVVAKVVPADGEHHRRVLLEERLDPAALLVTTRLRGLAPSEDGHRLRRIARVPLLQTRTGLQGSSVFDYVRVNDYANKPA
jgi:hypothetical protein